jgi:hypothetical protein
LVSGIWLFRDLDRWLPDGGSRADHAIYIRLSLKYWRAYAKNKLEGDDLAAVTELLGVVQRLSFAMERNPGGELKFPSPPKREDEARRLLCG